MKISPRVISFHYTLKNNEGEVLDSSSGSEPLSYLEGSGQIIPGLEEQIALMSVGDKRTVNVEAARAYGSHDAELVMDVPRSRLPKSEGLEVGDQFAGRGPNGEAGNIFTVVKLSDETVTLDGNHPLAGVDLTFEVEITEMRDATADEVAHGHAHGPGGHHDHGDGHLH
jgi:FKBP-type peptidyl-prolyl cis-trans isomerase SlyD